MQGVPYLRNAFFIFVIVVNNKPIGIFDSGYGGLTVFKSFLRNSRNMTTFI